MISTQDWLLGGLYLALALLAGYAALSAVLKSQRRHGLELLGLSFALGCGVISLLLFVFSLCGRVPDRASLLCIAAVALAILTYNWLTKGLPRPELISVQKSFDALTALGIVAVALILIAIIGVWIRSRAPVLDEIDAFAIWMFKAKWVMQKPLLPIPPEFRDPILSYTHQDYPLGFPLLIAGLFAMVGRTDDALGRIILLPLYLSLIAVIYSAIRRMHRRAIALIVTAIFAGAPALTQSAGVSVPESLLILTYAAAIAMLLRWVELNQHGDLVLAGLLIATAAFTKNEGLALMPVVGLAALCWAALQRSRRAIFDWLSAAAICGIAIAPWLIYRTHLPRTHEDYGSKLTSPPVLLQNLSRLRFVLPAYSGWFFNAARVGLLWYLLVIITALTPTAFRRGAVRLLWSLLLIQLGLYLASFMVTPWNVHILVPMVTARLITQASPLAVMLIALHLREMRWATQRSV